MSELQRWVCHSCKSKHISGDSEHIRVVGAMPDQKIFVCWLWIQIPCYQQRQIHHYQLAPSEARSKASCLLIANPDSLLSGKQHPPHPACYQRVQTHCYQRGQFHLCEQSWIHPYWRRQFHPDDRSQIHCYLFATSEARFVPTSNARSTTTCLLPQWTVSSLPVKPDPPLPACSHRIQLHSYQRSEIQHY